MAENGKPHNVAKTMIKKIVPFVIPKVTTTIVIDNHMVVIQIHIGKTIVKDVLLDGGFGVNIIIEQLKLKLGLPKRKLAPYNLRMVD
jgi:hypothetical protein